MDNQKEKVFTSDSVIFITENKDTLYGIGFGKITSNALILSVTTITILSLK